MKKKLISLIVIILTALTIIIGIHNWRCNDNFFDVSVAQVLTLFVALVIAFWANQYKNDQRKAKEHAERMLIKLQQLVTESEFYQIPADGDLDTVKKSITSTNRKISNYIRILCEYGKTLEFNENIQYIDQQFNDYKTKVGDHITDLDYLSKTEQEFRRIADNIDSKCEDIILKLYK